MEEMIYEAISDTQQRSEEWHAQRLGKFTASRFGDLMTNGRKKDEVLGQTALSYIYEKAAEILTGERTEIFGKPRRASAQREEAAHRDRPEDQIAGVEADRGQSPTQHAPGRRVAYAPEERGKQGIEEPHVACLRRNTPGAKGKVRAGRFNAQSSEAAGEHGALTARSGPRVS